jgi:hypothetical protein
MSLAFATWQLAPVVAQRVGGTYSKSERERERESKIEVGRGGRGWAAVGEGGCGDGRAWAGLGGEGVGGHNVAIKNLTNMFYSPYAKLQSVIARRGYVRFRQDRDKVMSAKTIKTCLTFYTSNEREEGGRERGGVFRCSPFTPFDPSHPPRLL